MQRQFAAAALAVAAAVTFSGCHQQPAHHVHKAAAPAPARAGGVMAALDSIPTKPESHIGGYTHPGFAHRGKCDTRADLLRKTGTGVRTNKNCTVTAGHWTDAYSGDVVNSPKQVDIDHMIPLAEAWRSGASQWSPELWTQFVNDLDDGETVVATASGPSGNRAKGDKTPDVWLPASASPAFQCDYTRRYVDTNAKWNERAKHEGHDLSMDAPEKSKIARILNSCQGGSR